MTARRPRREPSPGGESQPAFHPVYLRVLGAVLARRGVDVGAWSVPQSSGTDVDGDDAMLPLGATRELLRSAMAATATPWLGLELGAAAQAHTHGLVGIATFASGRLGEALATIARYAALRTRALAFDWRETGTGGELAISARLDLGEARGFVFDAMLVIIERILQSLSGTTMRDACYRVPGLAPAWLERYRDHLEGTVHFVRGDVLRLQFTAELLARSCLTADARSHARAAAECARLLEAHQQRRRVGERVRMLLADGADRLPGAEEIAARLHLSTRSLFRRLADEGHSLRALADELRSERARFWLRDTDLPIERIAERLGYAGASNFARCFKRWTGVTPGHYRQGPAVSGHRDSGTAR